MRMPVRSWLCVAVLLFLLAPGGLAAQARDISIDRFDARLDVRRDGSMQVTETLRIRFDGSWNGIERDVFLDHETGTGRVTRLRFDLESVTDAEGRPLRVEEEGIAQGRRLRIHVPDAVNATRTVVLRYRVPEVIRFFSSEDPLGERDELYWDVTGNAWEMPVARASATVSLPAGVEIREAWGYTGSTYSRERDAAVEIVANEVRIVSNQGFAPREGLTISITMAPGAIERPGAGARAFDWLLRFWPMCLPFLAFAFMYRRWNVEGRDPQERPISVQYEPPQNLSSVETGTLVDHTVEMHDITSMLVDLAVRGYLVIEEREEKKLLVFSETEYWFHQRRPRDDWGALAAHEQQFLSALFSVPSTNGALAALGLDDGDWKDASASGLPSVKLSDLENRFYKHIDGIRRAVYASLIRQGMYARRPDQVRNVWLLAAGILLVLAAAGAGFVADRPWLGDPVAVALGLGGCALIVAGFGLVMPTRTEAGARKREAALGFKEFLTRVEQDRFKRMITSPEQFERYLAYAMAFRVEESWARAFEDLYRTPPDWYRGRPGSTFRTTHFARSMSTMTSNASRTMASSPKSSSGSGGGGFSGGGSGGGGGRGF